MTSLDRNDREVTNLSLVLPGLHLNILETEKILQFGTKNSQRVWHFVIPAQVVKILISLCKMQTRSIVIVSTHDRKRNEFAKLTEQLN